MNKTDQKKRVDNDVIVANVNSGLQMKQSHVHQSMNSIHHRENFKHKNLTKL